MNVYQSMSRDEEELVISMFTGNRMKCVSQEASCVFEKSVLFPK